MAKSISDLPVEILTQIISILVEEIDLDYLTLRAIHLCSLSTVSRQFAFTMRPFIFKKAVVQWEPRGDIPFMRSVRENPDLAGMVHSLEIDSRYGGKYLKTTAAFEELYKLVGNLQNLHTLSISVSLAAYLDLDRLGSLRTIKLTGFGVWRTEEIWRLMAFGNLENMSFVIPAAYASNSHLASKESLGRTPQLLSLNMGDREFHILPTSLHNILEICPKIQNLRMYLPGEETIDEPPDEAGDPWEGSGHSEYPPSPFFPLSGCFLRVVMLFTP